MTARQELTDKVRKAAEGLGFDPVGIAVAQAPEHWDFFLKWLDEGYAGEMGWLGQRLSRRNDPAEVVPGARSILCVGMNYQPPEDSSEPTEGSGPSGTGRISRYAQGDDYHEVMRARLFELLDVVKELDPGSDGRVYVDTGPVLEREHAARAGVGWFGKHTNLIHPRTGSWFFLGEILLTSSLEPDAPVSDHCGSCTLCMDACPTEAIRKPYVLDSTRCISYLTIELRGAIPRGLRPGMGAWIYGCDICQEVCPWNQKHGRPTAEAAFQPRPGFARPDLEAFLRLDQESFSRQFRKSPIKRAKRRGLLRNVAVALGNLGQRESIPALVAALGDPEPLVRGHAAWALGVIGGGEAERALREARKREEDAVVIEEVDWALGKAGVGEWESGSGGDANDRMNRAVQITTDDRAGRPGTG